MSTILTLKELADKFSLPPKFIDRRQNIDNSNQKHIQNAVDAILNKIRNCKDNDGWQNIKFTDYTKEFKIPSSANSALSAAVYNHPNLLCKLGPGAVFKLRPRYFKWVSANDKIRDMLKYTDMYVNISSSHMDRFKAVYVDGFDVDPCMLLSAYDYLCFLGADKNWIRANLAALLTSKRGFTIQDALLAINSLVERKLIIYSEYSSEHFRGTSFITYLPDSNDDYIKAREELKNPQSLIVQEITRPSSQPSLKLESDTLQPVHTEINLDEVEEKESEKQRPTSKTAQEEQAEVTTIEDTDTKPDTSSTVVFNDTLQGLADNTNIIRSQMDVLFKGYQQAAEKALKEQNSKLDKSIAAFNALQEENNKLKEEIKELKAAQFYKDKELEAYKEYSNRIMLNLQQQLEILMGRQMTEITSFADQPPYRIKEQQNMFKAMLFKLYGETFDRVLQFKPDSKFADEQLH